MCRVESWACAVSGKRRKQFMLPRARPFALFTCPRKVGYSRTEYFVLKCYLIFAFFGHQVELNAKWYALHETYVTRKYFVHSFIYKVHVAVVCGNVPFFTFVTWIRANTFWMSFSCNSFCARSMLIFGIILSL